MDSEDYDYESKISDTSCELTYDGMNSVSFSTDARHADYCKYSISYVSFDRWPKSLGIERKKKKENPGYGLELTSTEVTLIRNITWQNR